MPVVLSGSSYEAKCAKVADAYANVSEAMDKFSNLLAALDPAILPEDEGVVSEIFKHLSGARTSLETF